MDNAVFDQLKTEIDDVIAERGDRKNVGIKLGLDLYSEFRRRQLLELKQADLLLYKWTLPSYEGYFVFESDEIGADGWMIGSD